MNIYFIDPSYVKDEGWVPLLDILKVEYVYSFIPKNELSSSLNYAIKNKLVASYQGEDKKTFADNCVFWLRRHLEHNVRIIIKDYPDKASRTPEIWSQYSSRSCYNNLKRFNDKNCLILLPLYSYHDEKGYIGHPHSSSEGLNEELSTHIASYCLNILKKFHGHKCYQLQTSFILFNEFINNVYRFEPTRKSWPWYCMVLNGKEKSFTRFIKHEIHKNYPLNFPLVEKDGKKLFTPIITSDGQSKFDELLSSAKKAEEEYEEELMMESQQEDWQKEVEELNRDFWNECGEAGSNCDSWPGWD